MLHARTLVFTPPPAAWDRALPYLEAGHVAKVVVRFHEPFWPQAPVWKGRRKIETFWHARDVAFPTWWTTAPREAPVLTGWAGGPAAEHLSGRTEEDLVGLAAASLAHMLGVSRVTVEDEIADIQHHDWSRDPFSLGAYSHVGVGGLKAQAALARVVEGTLVLAGEALDPDGIGTVEGALASGRRAARALVRSMAASSGRRSTRSGARRSRRSPRR